MFDEKDHPRGQPNNAGQFVKAKEKTVSELKAELQHVISEPDYVVISPTKKMTPAEKIASVHIDFDRDNILPELNVDTLTKLGVNKNKVVLLKGDVIRRNLKKHIDVSEEIMQSIITETLYNPIDVFLANPDNPNYFHLVAFIEVPEKDGLKMGLVLLDIDTDKECFEIVHAYYVNSNGFEYALNKTKKKD